MVANLLRSERAVQTSVHVVRAFVQLRQMIATNKELARRLDELEARYEVKRVLTPFSLEVKRVLTPFSLSTRNSRLSSTPSGNSWRPRNRNPGGGSGSSRTTDKLERRGSRLAIRGSILLLSEEGWRRAPGWWKRHTLIASRRHCVTRARALPPSAFCLRSAPPCKSRCLKHRAGA